MLSGAPCQCQTLRIILTFPPGAAPAVTWFKYSRIIFIHYRLGIYRLPRILRCQFWFNSKFSKWSILQSKQMSQITNKQTKKLHYFGWVKSSFTTMCSPNKHVWHVIWSLFFLVLVFFSNILQVFIFISIPITLYGPTLIYSLSHPLTAMVL